MATADGAVSYAYCGAPLATATGLRADLVPDGIHPTPAGARLRRTRHPMHELVCPVNAPRSLADHPACPRSRQVAGRELNDRLTAAPSESTLLPLGCSPWEVSVGTLDLALGPLPSLAVNDTRLI